MLKKITSIILSLLLVFNPLAARLVWAEEGGNEAVQETQIQEPELETEDVSEEPLIIEEEESGDATTVTGDADSLADVNTTVNTNLDSVSTEDSDTTNNPCIPPEGEIECPAEIEITNDNLADVGDEADSTATTGGNLITNVGGNTLMDTGNATAGATIDNEINTNVVVLDDEDEGDTDAANEDIGEEDQVVDEEMEEGELEEVGEEDGEELSEGLEEADRSNTDILIENNNDGNLANKADVLAGTGENDASENRADVTIETGEALAYANIVNLLNTNVIGSDFSLAFYNYLMGQNGDIDFNELWKQIINGENEGLHLAGEQDGGFASVKNDNLASLDNEINVTAKTGINDGNDNAGNVLIKTGNATALANVINLVNLNLIGSKFFLGVVNIFGDFVGDLILPQPEGFLNNGGGEESGVENQTEPPNYVFENDNQAEINGSVSTSAESGANEADNNLGDGLIETGDSTSYSNLLSLINTNTQRNNWFFLVVNSLGSVSGRIFGWSAPDAVEGPVQEDANIYQVGFDLGNGGQNGEDQDVSLESTTQTTIENQNQAQVENYINVSASSGQNQANNNLGDTDIITGSAKALANLFDLVNLNIKGSHWFLGLVNILGNWQGNMIFAHADVSVGLIEPGGRVAPGETFEYNLNYQNEGQDSAKNVLLSVDLPQGLIYLGDSSGTGPLISGNSYIWNVGTLESGESGSFVITVQVEPDFSLEPEQISFWSRLVPEVQAAENERESKITTSASIETSALESDVSNNNSSATTTVYFPKSQAERANQDGLIDQRQPVLEITAKNNVNDFVYPDDTVTFEITVKNTGEVSSHDTYLVQELFNEVPGGFGSAKVGLGTIEPGKSVTLVFGMALGGGELLPEGGYHTIARALGTAPNGDQISSNEARTDFNIKLGAVSYFETQAAGQEKREEVLGMTDAFCPDTKSEENIFPYVLLLLLSTLYLSDWTKIRLKSRSKPKSK